MAAAQTGDSPPTIDIDWRSIALFVAIVVGVWMAYAVTRAAPRTVVVVAVGALLAIGFTPVVDKIESRVKNRSISVGAVVASGVLLFSLVGLFLIPAAINQARDLPNELPRVTKDLTSLPMIGEQLEKNNVPQKVENFVETLPARLAGDATPLFKAGKSVANLAMIGIAVLVVALTLLLDGKRLLLFFARAIPVEKQPRANELWQIFYDSVGRYLTGSLTVAAIAGGVVLVIGLVMRVPLAPLAAAWVALWDLIPQIGGAMGGIPFIALAFTVSPITGLICAGLFVLYLQLENNLISPVIVGKAVSLSPLATMVAALIGVSAGGIVGALFAVPITGAVKELYVALRPEEPANA